MIAAMWVEFPSYQPYSILHGDVGVEDAPCPSLVECLEGAEDCRVGTRADAADMKEFAMMHKASIDVELPAHLLQSLSLVPAQVGMSALGTREVMVSPRGP